MDGKILRTLLKVVSDKDIEKVLNTIQEVNARENTDTEASTSSNTSTSSKRKRNSRSAERDQENGRKDSKQAKSIDVLAKLLTTDTLREISVPEPKPIQGYVTEETYLSLMEKYNNLHADYLSLQLRFELALDCLGDIGDQSDVDMENIEDTLETYDEVSPNEGYKEEIEELIEEGHDDYCGKSWEEHICLQLEESNRMQLEENNGEVLEKNSGVPSEENSEKPFEEHDKGLLEEHHNRKPLKENNAPAENEIIEEVPVQEPAKYIKDEQIEEVEDIIDNLTNYVSQGQWEILKRSQTGYLFVRNVMRILFDKAAILTCTVPEEPYNRSVKSSQSPLNSKKILVLKVLLNKYLDQKDDPEFTEIQKQEERRHLMQNVSKYVVYIKQKHREGVDITYL